MTTLSGARIDPRLLDGAPQGFPSLVEPLQREPLVGTALHHFLDADSAPTPGSRQRALVGAARDFRVDFAATGVPTLVDTADLVTLPYPVSFGLWRAAAFRAGFLGITNRLLVIRWTDAGGDRKTLLFEPSDVELGENTPYFRDIVPSMPTAVREKLVTRYATVPQQLATWGIDPAEVDYLVFDHLHTQDVRRWLGTTAPQADGTPQTALFPNAKILVQREELAAMVDLAPIQRPWYQVDTFKDVPADRIVALDGDTLLGPGVALLRTPGHTFGNQSLVVNTSTGIWASSENAIAAECFVPHLSRIPGVKKNSATWGRELVINANTIESAGTQYVSMMKEKLVVDPSTKDERYPQFLPSSELTSVWFAPLARPTFTQGGIFHGASLSKA